MSSERAESAPARVCTAREIDDALARLGFEAFREGQRSAVETVLEPPGRLLLVAPTGGGKSLCYQLPALLLEGTTLVVSPLISLMQDQVDALVARGVSATFLASTLPLDTLDERMRGLAGGRYDLVYVAPERLVHPEFRALLRELSCPLVAIDEAHCISEWGHDFRPEYMQIGELIRALPGARVIACTATATPIVRDEILERLGLPADTPQIIHGFARPNLSLRVHEVSGKKERDRWVDDALAEALGAPGQGRGAAIVYAPTRRITEEEQRRLLELGWRASAYHAGMEGEAREHVHRQFSAGEAEVVVATNAFGMGIDRADVRAVIHLAPPGSIESYYQEVGRAGRDGEKALALMLISASDMPRRRHLIDQDADGGAASSEVVQHKWNLFLELMRFAEGGSCRHDTVLRYFGDEAETLAGCGQCDVCLRLSMGEEEAARSEEEVTLIVRKALSGVARVHGRFGLSAAVALLRGQKDPRLERDALHRVPTFGVLAEFGDAWLTQLLRRCVTAGLADFFGGDRPVIALTDHGIAAMRGERPIRMLLPPSRARARRRAAAPGEGGRGAAAAGDGDGLSEADLALFEALRSHRLEVARLESVPPYVVASDRTLREIATLRPRDRDELCMAHGIGPSKAEKYGAGLLEVVAEHDASLAH